MTKAQFFGNVILFVPLIVINFFVYGIDGCSRLIKDMKKYAKKYLKNA